MTSNSLWRSSFSLKNQLLDIGQRRCPELYSITPNDVKEDYIIIKGKKS